MNEINLIAHDNNEPYVMLGDDEKSLVFYVSSTEMLRICENGDFIVKGKKVANDSEIYGVFKAWTSSLKEE